MATLHPLWCLCQKCSLSSFTLIKLCCTKALEWSSLVPGPKAKSSSEIVNPTPFIVSYQQDAHQIRSVAQSCPTLCDLMNRSTPGFPVHHQLPEFTQTHVHWVSDAIQPSHPLSSPSPLAPSPSQHQSLFQWVNSSHEVAKVQRSQITYVITLKDAFNCVLWLLIQPVKINEQWTEVHISNQIKMQTWTSMKTPCMLLAGYRLNR